MLQKQLLENGREATDHLNRMVPDMQRVSRGFDEIAAAYPVGDLKKCRKGEKITEQMAEKMFNGIMLLAVQLFSLHPRVARLSRRPEVRDSFIFRFAICSYVLALKWIEVGGTGNIAPRTLLNDMADVNFATFATVFDGLLPNDNEAQSIYAGADVLLREVFFTPDAA